MIIARRADGKPGPPDRPRIIMHEVTDPEVPAAAMARRERADRNYGWLEAHGPEIFEQYRGKCICVSEGEVFAAETSPEAIAMAKAAHPHDDGRIIYRVPSRKAIRIY